LYNEQLYWYEQVAASIGGNEAWYAMFDVCAVLASDREHRGEPQKHARAQALFLATFLGFQPARTSISSSGEVHDVDVNG
jgi:hypothetical protein